MLQTKKTATAASVVNCRGLLTGNRKEWRDKDNWVDREKCGRLLGANENKNESLNIDDERWTRAENKQKAAFRQGR